MCSLGRYDIPNKQKQSNFKVVNQLDVYKRQKCMSGFGKFIKGTASVTKVMSTAMGGFDTIAPVHASLVEALAVSAAVGGHDERHAGVEVPFAADLLERAVAEHSKEPWHNCYTDYSKHKAMDSTQK